MLKASKTRIILKDGRELQYHLPPPKIEPKTAPEISNEIIDDDLLQKIRPGQLLEVEIGPGKGEFLAARAKAYPNRFFLGIDKRDDRFHLTRKKLERATIENQGTENKNWLVLNTDARRLLRPDLPPIEILHIYHPDPWPKKRHFKNRFFRSPDAKSWAQALRSGGELRISTDHRAYFEEILDIVGSWDFLELALIYKKTSGMGEPLSHFESIFLNKNEAVYKAVFLKTIHSA